MSKKPSRYPSKSTRQQDDGAVKINTDPRSELDENAPQQEYLPRVNFLAQEDEDNLQQSTYRPKFKPLESQGLRRMFNQQGVQSQRKMQQADFKRLQKSGAMDNEDQIAMDYYRGKKQYQGDNKDISQVVGRQQQQDQQQSDLQGGGEIKQQEEKQENVDELYKYMLTLTDDKFSEQLKKFHQISQILIPVDQRVFKGSVEDDVDWGMDEGNYENTHCRYTPIVSEDSRYFESDGYVLRQNVLDGGRRIKMCIVITLYNEDFGETFGTLLGIAKNIQNMCKKNKKYKKYPDWKEVLVVLVQDGVERADISTLAGLEQIGLYQPGYLIKKNRLKEDTTAHLFEFTAKLKDEDKETFTCPIQMSFLTKAKNAGKLSSHAWFFNAICDSLQPDYTVLFDAGTTPYGKALGYMYRNFEDYPNCGACAGELEVDKPYQSFWAVVQFLEWKFAYVLEVPFQHLCGYMQVLPGAFSSYRWKAIKGVPLSAYFRGYYKEESMNTFLRNVYLAEDRVLCVEVVAKANCAYRLSYVKKARARADPCSDLQKLMGQRRRWLNGSFFAAVFGFLQFRRIWMHTKHSVGQKFIFFLELFYLAFELLFANFLGVALLFTFMKMVTQEFFKTVSKDNKSFEQIGTVILAIYTLLILVQIIVNMNNKPKDVKWVHNTCAIIFGIYTIMFTAFLVYFIFRNFKPTAYRQLFGLQFDGILIIIMFLITIIVVVLHGYTLPILSGGLQYYFMSAAYINVLQIYAFTNSHDLSWGTKGLVGGGAEQGKAGEVIENIKKARTRYQRRTQVTDEKQKSIEEMNKERENKDNESRIFSTRLILYWLTFNLLFLFIIARMTEYNVDIPCVGPGGFICGKGVSLGSVYLQILLALLGAFRIVQLLVSLIFVVRYQFGRCCGCGKRSKVTPVSQNQAPDFMKNKQNLNGRYDIRPPPQAKPPQQRPQQASNNQQQRPNYAQRPSYQQRPSQGKS